MRRLILALAGLVAFAPVALATQLSLTGAGPSAVGGFDPVNPSVSSLLVLGQNLATLADSSGVQSGGTLTVNSQSLGSYSYVVKDGNQTVSSFTSSDWFSATDDSEAAAIIVKGNLTINSGQVFKPTARKLFTLIYVTGDLAISGEISMSARGANHSASGSNISAAAIRIATGTYSSVSNPEVPAAGASGGASVTTSATVGNVGSAGAAGGTGGGGSGSTGGLGGTSGAGATGTSFSGGAGGGAANGGTATGGGADGGAGGNAAGVNVDGGSGNPGGSGISNGGPGATGTGGVLVIICVGQFSGAGTVTAAGAGGGIASVGGGSGGGSVTIMYGTDTSSITPSAAGGVATGGFRAGGNGGAGTARKLAL